MSRKIKRIVLQLKEKATILKRIKNGETDTKSQIDYGAEKPTIATIKKNGDSTIHFVTVLVSKQGSLE